MEVGYSKQHAIYYMKVLMIGLLPIILTILGAIIFIFVRNTCKRRDNQFQLYGKIRTTAFILMFLCNPLITTMSFSLFNCFSYEDGHSYLREDLNVQCWTREHLTMALSIGATFIAVWTIAFPLVITIQLRRHKNLFDNH